MVEGGVETRMAVNESLLREANDRFRRRYETSDVQDENEFVCECGARDWSATIRLTLGAYEAVRREGRSVVALGHAHPGRVVVVGARYLVVEGLHGDS
jgi:hypothetical protein